jgi:penicillin amidase
MGDPFTALQSSLRNSVFAPREGGHSWFGRLLRIILFLALLAAVGAGAGLLWLYVATRSALPTLDGDAYVAGLSAPVTVRRDTHGVPHIDATTQLDLFEAQGYVTAQDRLWQMDVYRRNADGTLAQIMGPALVRHDRVQRVLQFRRTAQRIYANLPADERARLDAYARGVNLYIDQHRNALPPEFRLLLYKPEPWTGVDSLSVGMMMVQMLDTHFYAKLAREKIATDLHNPKLENDLYPVGSWRDHPPTGVVVDLSLPHPEPPPGPDEEDEEEGGSSMETGSGMGASLQLNDADLRMLRSLVSRTDCAGCTPGSNNWVIAGEHTASGKPLLSNDMHLSLTEPNIWYMADLKAPGYHATGVTLPGMPYVIAGHNEHVAWGFTALYADVQDLYVEQLDGRGNYRATDGTWKPLTVDREVIHVRGGRDVTVKVQMTDHGPLLNSLFDHAARPVALKWTLYDTTLNTIPLYAIDVASNWTEFSAALADWCWPTQNVVYADDQGHIAYHAVGRVPLRPGGLQGVPIVDAAHEWQGYIPFDAMPGTVDPPAGFVATANSRVTTDASPYPLTLEWGEPYRIQRIYKSLERRDHLTPGDLLAVQTDVYSEVDQEFAQRFAYAIDHASNRDAQLRAAADLMRSWNGELTTDSAAASVVVKAREALWPMLLASKLGKDAAEYEWSESTYAEEQIVMNADTAWLPPGYKNWNDLLAEAVRRGMKQGKAPADVKKWTYGSWHMVEIDHPLARFLPYVGRMADTGPEPLSGDTTTVKQVRRDFGPSQRFTMDWSNVDGATENIVLGESGNPLSPYFRDQWNDWYGGKTFALPFSQAAVAAQTRHTLRLLP